MRETFNDLGDLLGYYQFLKLSVTSMPTILPRRDFGDNSQKYRAKSQQLSIEDKFSFIGDIELFPMHYYYSIQKGYKPASPDCLLLIFHLKFCPYLSIFESYGHLALHFRKRILFKKEPLPKRLTNSGNLYHIGKDMYEKAGAYFIGKGYLNPKINEKIA